MDGFDRAELQVNSPEMFRAQQRGYSLVELLVVITLVSIFSLITVPSFRAGYSEIAVDSLSSDLHSILRLGRDEALTTGDITVLCASQTGDDCAAGAWDNGWLLFVDANDDSTGGGGSVDSGDLVLRTGANWYRRLGISVTVAQPQIRFDARGETNTALLILCGLRIAEGGHPPASQTLVVGLTGLIAKNEDSALCD